MRLTRSIITICSAATAFALSAPAVASADPSGDAATGGGPPFPVVCIPGDPLGPGARHLLGGHGQPDVLILPDKTAGSSPCVPQVDSSTG